MDQNNLSQFMMGLKDTFIYDPKTKRPLPQSALWDVADMAQAQSEYAKGDISPEEFVRKFTVPAQNIVMAGTTAPRSSTRLITQIPRPKKGFFEGVGKFELLTIDRTTGKTIGSRIYKTTTDMRNAMKRIPLEKNQMLMPRDITP